MKIRTGKEYVTYWTGHFFNEMSRVYITFSSVSEFIKSFCWNILSIIINLCWNTIHPLFISIYFYLFIIYLCFDTHDSCIHQQQVFNRCDWLNIVAYRLLCFGCCAISYFLFLIPYLLSLISYVFHCVAAFTLNKPFHLILIL